MIHNAFCLLLDYPNITTPDEQLLSESLVMFEKENIDFVDSLLISYNHIQKAKIHSFDKKIIRLCH
jgi:hypothetical protein